jgi:hypothetical protein
MCMNKWGEEPLDLPMLKEEEMKKKEKKNE